jgi:hypothetical protein
MFFTQTHTIDINTFCEQNPEFSNVPNRAVIIVT